MIGHERSSARRGEWRVLGPALACWGFAAAAIHVPGTGRLVAFVAAVCGAVACVVLLVVKARRNGGVMLMLCASLLLIGARVDMGEHARDATALVQADASARPVTATVVLAGYPERSSGPSFEIDGPPNERGWVRGTVTEVDGEALGHVVPVMLWLPAAPEEHWAPGTQLHIEGTLARSPPASRTAYEFSVARMTESLEQTFAAAVGEQAAAFRNTLRDAAEGMPGARMVPGLAVGDTSLIDDELDAIMLESSLTHLVAVSGANCALIISAMSALSAALGCGRRARIIVAAGALAAFVIVVGPDVSVQRASVMATVLLVSNFGGKSKAALPSLGAAVFVLLIADPWQSMQAGFALSVAATAGILLWVPQLESWLRRRLGAPKALALPVAVACVAQATCAPILLLLQPGLSVAGVLANLLAAPAAPFGTALGVISALLLQVSSLIGTAVLWLASWPAMWIEASGVFAVSLPAGRWYWSGGVSGALLLAAVEVLLLVAAGLSRRQGVLAIWGSAARRNSAGRGRESVRNRRRRVLSSVVAGSAAGVLVAVVVVVPVSVQLGVPRDWIVVACDVGQGDALLVRDPERPQDTVLIDTGDDPEKLDACLELFGVERIALLVLTHDDRDHVGALDAVIRRTQAALVSPPAGVQHDVRHVTEALEQYEVPYATAKLGMSGGSAEGLHWEVVGPPVSSAYRSTNAASVVLHVEVRGVSMVFLGDTGEREQAGLMARFPHLETDIVKVAHHGSSDQSPGLYGQLSPNFALVSVGENRYGHPDSELLNRLVADRVSVLRTDELGSIALSLVDGNLEAWAAGEQSSVRLISSGA